MTGCLQPIFEGRTLEIFPLPRPMYREELGIFLGSRAIHRGELRIFPETYSRLGKTSKLFSESHSRDISPNMTSSRRVGWSGGCYSQILELGVGPGFTKDVKLLPLPPLPNSNKLNWGKIKKIFDEMKRGGVIGCRNLSENWEFYLIGWNKNSKIVALQFANIVLFLYCRIQSSWSVDRIRQQSSR